MTNNRDKTPDLTLDLIGRAAAGEEEAVLTILRRYDAEITKWATVKEIDSEWHIINRIDEDLKAEIQGGYLRVIRKWRALK